MERASVVSSQTRPISAKNEERKGGVAESRPGEREGQRERERRKGGEGKSVGGKVRNVSVMSWSEG